jgi:hypothetical protein
MSPKNIFICYRRDDAEGYAGRLYDRLNSRFPRRVFMDVTGISPGADFSRVIQETVGSCHVLIAIIGRHWVTVTDASNRRRLDLADDYVRHEIATALNRNITVIPVLVRGAEMPSRESLPPDLAALSTRNALEISDGDFDHDAQRLIKVLENVCGEPGVVPPPPTAPGRSNCLIFAVIGILAVGAIVFVLFLLGFLAFLTQTDQSVVQPSSKPEYSQAPSTEPSVAQDADAVNFHPVGSWIVTFANGEQIELGLHGNNNFEYGDEAGTWEYSPAERKLTLTGADRFVITIESQEGNAFVGEGQRGYSNFPVRLTPP